LGRRADGALSDSGVHHRQQSTLEWIAGGVRPIDNLASIDPFLLHELPMRPVLITLLLMASAAHSENWLQIADLNPKGSILFIDSTSIDRDSEPRKAWFKTVYSADRPIGNSYRRVSPDVSTYRSELTLGHFNCTERTIAVSRSVLHGADDQVVGEFDAGENPLRIRDVTPQSVGGLMLRTVCISPTDGQPLRPLAKFTRVANPDDFYPSAARRRGEEGSPVVNVCVGPSGNLLRDPEVTDTSGFPDIDAAAIKVAQNNRYAAGIENGAAAPESCIKFKVKFARLNH
jgi:TonB family protein